MGFDCGWWLLPLRVVCLVCVCGVHCCVWWLVRALLVFDDLLWVACFGVFVSKWRFWFFSLVLRLDLVVSLCWDSGLVFRF